MRPDPNHPPFPLLPNQVHLCLAALDRPRERLEELAASLSPDERERAARYQFPHVRDHFMAARGTLRELLGGYLAIPPADVIFHYGPRGKPSLDPSQAGSGLQFNLAHSAGLGLIALTHQRSVGVDLEQIHPIPEMEILAGRFLSPGETAALLSVSEEQRLPAFFRGWTCKEAFIKAVGEGFSRPLNSFEVVFHPGEAPRLVWVAEAPADPQAWSLYDLPTDPGYQAALCVEGSGHELRYFQFS